MIVNNKLVRMWKKTTHVLYCSIIHMDKQGRTGKILIQKASSGKYSSGILGSFIT
jgi:hypothetical protein